MRTSVAQSMEESCGMLRVIRVLQKKHNSSINLTELLAVYSKVCVNSTLRFIL